MFGFLICDAVVTVPTAGLRLVGRTERCQAHSLITHWDSSPEADRRVTQRG